MTIQEFRIGHAKLESLRTEAERARIAIAVRRIRFSAFLRSIADRLAAA